MDDPKAQFDAALHDMHVKTEDVERLGQALARDITAGKLNDPLERSRRKAEFEVAVQYMEAAIDRFRAISLWKN